MHSVRQLSIEVRSHARPLLISSCSRSSIAVMRFLLPQTMYNIFDFSCRLGLLQTRCTPSTACLCYASRSHVVSMTNQEQNVSFQSLTKTSTVPTSISHLQRHPYPAIGRLQKSRPPPALEAFEHLFFPARAAQRPNDQFAAMLASFVQLRLDNCSESASDATLTDAGRCPNPTESSE
jgi:hypothetical protein